MSVLDKWAVKHPEWFANLRFEIEEGHNGWDALIDEAMRTVEEVLSACSYEYFEIIQIKEKFGDLRIYFRETGVPAEARKRLDAAMKKAGECSRHVCEICGASADPGCHGGHICVRCPSCALKGWKPIDTKRS